MQQNATLLALIGTSVEIIHHAGNIRTCMFGVLAFQKEGNWFTVTPSLSSASSIRFPNESVHKIQQGKFHSIIYIA